MELGIFSAFFAGVLTFLAPCTLPLVPGFLGIISSVSFSDMQDPNKSKSTQRRIFFNALLFVIGFSLVFVVFGVLAGFLGQQLVQYRKILSMVSGVIIIFMGLFMLKIIKSPILLMEKRIKIPKFFKSGEPTTSILTGVAFALGWTPCYGPVVASIMLLASTRGSVAYGGLMLLVFSLGVSLPFLLTALLVGRATKFIHKLSRFFNIISIVGGVFIVIIGLLLLTNNFSLVIKSGYQIFHFINYDKLLKYL